MTKNTVERTLLALTILFTILATVMVLWKLFGNSPTSEQLTWSLFAVIAAWLFSLTYKIGVFEGKYAQSDMNMKESFARVREDLSEIKKELSEFRQKKR